MLNAIGRSLKNFPTIPMPPERFMDNNRNILVVEETSYYGEEMAEQHRNLLSKLNREQKHVYESVLNAVDNDQGGFFLCMGVEGVERFFCGILLLPV